MKITKYEHSCLVVEGEGGNKLVIDPGEWSPSFPSDQKYDCLVISHIHMDHFSAEIVKKMLSINPDLQIFTVKQVHDELEKLGISSTIVTAGQKIDASNFSLEFFGGQHAIIHPDYPVFDNICTLVDGKLYHPGDSLVMPDKKVEWLAVPATAPWMKASEAMDFVTAIKPKHYFFIHEVILSEIGYTLATRLLGGLADSLGAELHHFKAGQSIDI
jgi:L-ascorbate metabolism protein UlaG (beta-lactamase superfamily)